MVMLAIKAFQIVSKAICDQNYHDLNSQFCQFVKLYNNHSVNGCLMEKKAQGNEIKYIGKIHTKSKSIAQPNLAPGNRLNLTCWNHDTCCFFHSQDF